MTAGVFGAINQSLKIGSRSDSRLRFDAQRLCLAEFDWENFEEIEGIRKFERGGSE